MKAIVTYIAFAAMAGTALAQTEQRPADHPLSVKPIASQAQTTDTDISDRRSNGWVIPTSWICRATARASGTPGQEGNRIRRGHRRQGRPHQAWTVIARAPSVEARRQLDDG